MKKRPLFERAGVAFVSHKGIENDFAALQLLLCHGRICRGKQLMNGAVFMFFEYGEQLEEKSLSTLQPEKLTAGYVSGAELRKMEQTFGFSEATVHACQVIHSAFRSGVEIYDDYTFTELRIVDPANPADEDDCVALYIKKNLFLVVDVLDKDRSTYQKYMQAIQRFTPKTMTLEKLIYAFMDELLSKDVGFLEKFGNQVSAMEESVLNETPADHFSQSLLKLKKRLQEMHNYYEQILDILEAFDANENELFDAEPLMYITNLEKRVIRMREDVDSLNSDIIHVQDAYSAYLDMRMNNTMKYLTVLTTVFFPLTILVGWYGMNFHAMPELSWRFGYVYVICLSVLVVAGLILVAKKKKWF